MAYEKPYEARPGDGSAWPNDRKTEDWHPDFRGKVMLPDGKTHWLDVQPKTSKDGRTWYKVKIGREVQSQGQAPGAPAYSAAHQPFPAQSEHDRAKANGFAELNNDIPF